VRAALLLLLCATLVSAQPADRYDLILRNGTIVDGTGRAPYRGDVGVVKGFIARVGDIGAVASVDEIDVRGLYVAPGFINLHSHAAVNALASAENMLTQGVTFELINADGGGGIDIAQQLQLAAVNGLALNVGAYIGFNSAWTAVVGEADRRPTAEEITRMREILVRNLDAGAWGVSAGLDYKPAYFASAEEVVEVVKATAAFRTNFTNHDRLTPETKYSSRAAIAETIGIGARAGLVPVITHMKVQGREQGSAGAVLEMMADATRRGTYTAADAYPYLAGQTGLGALLVPAWAQDGGRDKMLERFNDPAQRVRIVREVEEAMHARFGGPQGVFLPATRRELTDVMKDMNVGAGEAVVRLLETDNQGAILRFGSEDDLIEILKHPSTSVACDCGASLPGRGSHPRNQGTYPRVLGRYVRELKSLTWQEAIRKMTLLPATTIGVVDRGAIAPGMIADITVFDPATIIDRATYEEPSLPSVGIRHVVVNGGVVLRDGRTTGVKSGRVLRRTRAMPSRPMTPATASRTLSAAGTLRGADGALWQIAIDVAQTSRRRFATGSITIRDEQGRVFANTRDLGMLQVSGGWASVTATAHLSTTGEPRAVAIVVEQSDPWRDDRAPSITLYWLDLDGSPTGVVDATGRADRARISSR
jgi:N-acyl-D-aspartate/D-glutamate deacylase